MYIHQSFCVEIRFIRVKDEELYKEKLGECNVPSVTSVCLSHLTVSDLGVRMGYLDQSEIHGVIQDSTRKNLYQNLILSVKSLNG